MDAPNSSPAPTTPTPSTSAPSNPTAPTAAAPAKPAVRGPDGKFQNSAGAQPPEPGTEAAAKAAEAAERKAEAERRKYRRKVNGQEEELELSDEDVNRELGKARAYELSAKEIKREREFWQKLKSDAAKDPGALRETLKELGVDARKAATQWLLEEAEQDMLTPEQRLQRENETLKKQISEREEAEKTAQTERAQRELDERLWAEEQPKMLAALEKADLPRSPATLRMFAEIGQEALDSGLELTHEQIASEVLNRITQSHSRVLRSMSVQQVTKLLGPELVKGIIKQSVESLRANASFAPKTPAEPPAPKQDEPKGYRSELEARRRLGV